MKMFNIIEVKCLKDTTVSDAETVTIFQYTKKKRNVLFNFTYGPQVRKHKNDE